MAESRIQSCIKWYKQALLLGSTTIEFIAVALARPSSLIINTPGLTAAPT